MPDEAPPPVSVAPLLSRLVDPSKGVATASEIAAAIALIFTNKLSPIQCSALLTLLTVTGRGHEPAVIAQAAAAMRAAANPVDLSAVRSTVSKRGRREGGYKGGLCDIVGTGGDGHSTFNVSTTASIICSSLLLIAKHGARASSSKSGSADMLQAIAPRAPIIEAVTAERLPSVYERSNYAFLFAPVFNVGVRHVAAVRRELGFRTIFNILGPLANPVDSLVEARVYGVATKELGPIYAEALRMGGAKKAMVVCGAEDLDEISCAGKTYCWRLMESPNPEFWGSQNQQADDDENYTTSDEEGASQRTLVHVEHFELEPADFGLPCHALSEVLPGKGPQANAHILNKMLTIRERSEDPTLHFVLMNAAALFVISGVCDADSSNMGQGDTGHVIKDVGPGGGRWKEGVRRARWAVESGAAMGALRAYIDFTHNP